MSVPASSWLAASLALCTLAAWAAPGLKLHVPSPDWRDQVIYFVMTDRFDDGDAANNDQGAGEFDRRDGARYQGGDLRGLARRLDYVRGLGATALWITPPVANQWLEPGGRHAGYHGYWAEHFMRVDAHLGRLADYRRLSDRLHRRGMFLVQDIVLNHSGNYFGYPRQWSAADATAGFERYVNTPPVVAPTQAPFHLNDARDAAQRAAGIYHWTPDIRDHADPQQELNHQMGGLDDLNTENAEVRRALRRSYGYWLRKVGVDAFRVDTAFYVPPQTFADFLRADDAAAPGIEHVARQTGRRRFLTFGEGFGIDRARSDEQARRIERYMTGDDGAALLPGMLNFPLYGALADVFARGQPTADLAHRIDALARLHARPHLMPTFVDNHDVDRFLAGGSEAALRQALLALMTLPGIPTLYYGTEQGFKEQRASMFAAGHGAGGRDHFDTTVPLYRYIARATALRRDHRMFSRGWPRVLRSSAAGPGLLAYEVRHGAQRSLVVFNTADQASLLDGLEPGAAPGTRLRALFGIDGSPGDRVLDAAGRLTLVLPPRSGCVWKLEPPPRATGAAKAPRDPGIVLEMDALPQQAAGGVRVSGVAHGAGQVQVVVDGNLEQAVSAQAAADGRWQARLGAAQLAPSTPGHAADTPRRVVAWSASTGRATPAQELRYEPAWQVLADVEDPLGDDRGPRGSYVYPTDPSYGARGLMDLRRVQVASNGAALRIDLGMNEISTAWSPANGFDHVAFTVFIELPGRSGGSPLMPLQDARLPGGMRWHYRLRAHGWSNALFAATAATPTNEGTPVTPAPAIEADAALRRVRFTLPLAALGSPATLSGARVYVATWDYDGGYRALSPEPGQWSVGGGREGQDARVMDDSAVIPLN